jgi:hypothetical protein
MICRQVAVPQSLLKNNQLRRVFTGLKALPWGRHHAFQGWQGIGGRAARREVPAVVTVVARLPWRNTRHRSGMIRKQFHSCTCKMSSCW